MININDRIWIYKDAISFIERREDDGNWYLHMNNGEVLLVSANIAQNLIDLGVNHGEYAHLIIG